MGRLEYDEFDVLLERDGEQFTARVVRSPTGPTSAVSFVPPGTEQSLRLLVLTMRAVHGMRRLESEAAPDTKEFGAQLFDALFHDHILSAFRGSLHVAAEKGRGLRLRLRFGNALSLASLPWEMIYDSERHRFPCQLDKYPVVRWVEVPDPVPALAVTGAVRMLVVISGPSDYPELDVEKEWSKLETVLHPFVRTGQLQVVRLETASLDAVRQAVKSGDYHIFHFIGHGGIDTGSGDGVLVFTDSRGFGQKETGSTVSVILSKSPIRLAVLNSCDGARVSEVDPYAGTALSLVSGGIPAVVAMQFEITDLAAIAFSQDLYESIIGGSPIDLAVTSARQTLLTTSRSEWATPVLYLRADDGVIFDLDHQEVQPPTTSEEPLPDKHAGEEGPAADRPPPVLGTPPAAPTGLHGTVTGKRVKLGWDQPPSRTSVDQWEIYRDKQAIGWSPTKGAADTLPGPGAYSYAVLAVGTDGLRSMPSAEFVARARRRPWPWLLAGLLVPLAVVLWFLLRPEPPPPLDPPAQPLGLAGKAVQIPSTSNAKVDLTWDEPAAGTPAVVSWEVRRDGEALTTSTSARAQDTLTAAGTFTYTVVAVGETQKVSPSSAPLVVKWAPPKPSVRADMTIRFFGQEPGGGSGEQVVTFQTDNRDTVDTVRAEIVTIEVDSPGELLDATVLRVGQAEAVPCPREGRQATCSVGDHPTLGVAKVFATVLEAPGGFDVTARVSSQTADPNPDNDHATRRVEVATQTTTTTATP